MARESISFIQERVICSDDPWKGNKGKNLKRIWTMIRQEDRDKLLSEAKITTDQDESYQLHKSRLGRRVTIRERNRCPGEVYILFNQDYEYYIGSAVQIKRRIYQHLDNISKDKWKKKLGRSRVHRKFSKCDELFFLPIRRYENLADARCAELALIKCMKSPLNVTGQNGRNEEQIIFEKEPKASRRRRRRPGKRFRNDGLANIDDYWLVRKKTIARYTQQLEDYNDLRNRKGANADPYLPINYDLLVKSGQRIDMCRLREMSPLEHPLLCVRRTIEKVLGLKDRIRMLARAHYLMRIEGLPTRRRISATHAYKHESIMCKTLRQSLIQSEQDWEIQMVLRREIKLVPQKISKPRLRVLYNAHSKVRNLRWDKVGQRHSAPRPLDTHFGGPAPPGFGLDIRRKINEIIRTYGFKYNSSLTKIWCLAEKAMIPISDGEIAQEAVRDSMEAVRLSEEGAIIQDDKCKNRGFFMSTKDYRCLVKEMLQKDTARTMAPTTPALELALIRFREKDFKILKLPSGYYSVKGKCWNKDGHRCNKPPPHQCGRKIISFAGCFSQKDVRKMRSAGKKIREAIKENWKSCADEFELADLKNDIRRLNKIENCPGCNVSIPETPTRATFGATSFFEEILLSLFKQAANSLKRATSNSPGVVKAINLVERFITTYRSCRFGDKVFRMRENRGAPIGGPFSSCVSSICLAYCEHYNAGNLRNNNVFFRRHEDDVMGSGFQCVGCLTKLVERSYAHPFSLEDHNSNTNEEIECKPIDWCEHRFVDRPGATSLDGKGYANPSFRVPRLKKGDEDYVETVILSKFRHKYPSTRRELVTYLPKKFVKKVLRKHRIIRTVQ